MMCDFILAAENAKFGQPEILIGTIPGAGGTQRLPRFIGKAKAMEMALTGRMMDAEEAERAGLVSRIVPANELVDVAVATAEKIANLSQPIVMLAKESVNRAYETTLAEGIHFERRVFHSTFSTEDQKKVCLRSPKNALPNSSIADRRPQTKIRTESPRGLATREAWISAGLGLDATVMRHYKPRRSIDVKNGI